MNFFKLLLIFALLLFGSFGQRFLRHSNNDDALIDGKDSDNLLSSDGLNAQQNGDDVKLTGYAKEIELELSQLMFEFCSQRIAQNKQLCMNQRVFVCYDAENPPVDLQEFLQDGCGPNKCRFEAGISPGGGNNVLWFMLPVHSTAEADVVQEKKESVKPEGEMEEKKKALEEEKKPKAAKKEKKVVQNIQLKPSKEITQENVPKEVPPKKVLPKKMKAPIEPTLDDPTTGASITATENQQPHVSVPKAVIHPAPLQPASKAITQYSRSSSRKGSLSGRHEIGMQIMVEKPSETIKRRSPDSIDDAIKDKLERFYPSDSARPRPLETREITLFCCTKISIMFKSIELLVDIAIERLSEHGAKFGDNETVVELSAEAERYVQSSTTPEYVRSFAFGGIFRELIDSDAEIHELCPIPLLFIIVLQRRYSVLNRRKACTWIRRQMPIVFAEFSLKERKTLSYPITAIEDAYKMNPDGFKNIAGLDTESGMEEQPTQDSVTHASKKNRKKKTGGGKKKLSKKRR